MCIVHLNNSENSSDFILLKSLPGVGKILSMAIYVETGTISRFKDARHYSSYCRCVESKRISNGKQKGSNNRKNGNPYLSWALMEAATFAIRFHPEVKKYYQKRLNKVHRVVALKSVAHKLAQAIYYILKNGVEFDMNKAF